MRHTPIDPALFIAHRRQLLELLPQHCVAIVHAADVPPTNGDGTLKLQPAADLFWLTGIEQEESVLVLAPDAADPAHREMLFVREPTELLCTWEGAKLSKEQAQQISGIAKVRWVADLPGVLHTLLCESEGVMLNSNEHERAKVDVEPRDLRLARQLIEK
jgi:Xaa-Pro aminopeptidase